MSFRKSLLRAYSVVAVLFFNTVILLAVVNLVIAGRHMFRSSAAGPSGANAEMQKLVKLHPSKSQNDVGALLAETWTRPLAYEDFTHFREGSVNGNYVKVSEAGFRMSKNQAPWPPVKERFNIFVFGGSTAFGYGVSDDETIASALQDELAADVANVAVYNFGRGYYFSSQERSLFQRLLVDGFVPNAAVFVDGLNDFYHHDGKPSFSRDMQRMFVQRNHKWTWGDHLLGFFRTMPLGEVTVGKIARASESRRPAPDDDRVLNGIIERYLANQKLIRATAEAFGVRPVFVWQPLPTYKYDLEHHAFASGGFADHALAGPGYELFAREYKDSVTERDFLWCADMQENLREPLYVDRVHYTPGMTHRLAREIARLIAARKLLEQK